MVRTRGAMLSLDAAGTVGNAIAFSHWKGRSYLKKRSIPTDLRSGGQVASRLLLTWLNTQWSTLSGADRDTWTDQAEASQVSPSSRFVGANLERWARFATPTKAWPAAEVLDPPVLYGSRFAAYDGVMSFSYNVEIFRPNDPWGLLIFMDDSTGFTPGKANLVDVHVLDDEDPHVWTVRDIQPATYYLRQASFTPDGVIRISGTERSFTVFTQ